MKFAVQVTAGPYGSDAGESAYQFIRAAIAGGHEIIRVFFYHEGAYQGMASMEPPADEFNPTQRWTALSREHAIDLVICISAAQRRGLWREGELAQPAPAFRIGGLGLWVEACIKADRVLTFKS